MSPELSPHTPDAESKKMRSSHRAFKRLLTVVPAVGLFLLLAANPFAQSNKLPAPSSHVSDFAGVIDGASKTRLEGFLQKLKEKSNIELYVAIVDSTGTQEIAAFSQQLAREWNIGAKATPRKSLLLVVSTGSKTSFTQFSRSAQSGLPEGILGEMSYRMSMPLTEGHFFEAVDSGVRILATALADKVGFKVSDLESSVVAEGKSEAAAESPKSVLVSATDAPRTRKRVVSDATVAQAQATPPVEVPRTEPTPTETPATEPTPTESPKPEAVESPKPETVEEPKTESPSATRKKPPTTKPTARTTNTAATKKTPEEIREEELDELEEVELTLTKPLAERAVALREFLAAYPKSKARPRALELLISTHAALGDQKLKNGDIAGGIEHFTLAINEADVNIPNNLFSGVIAQIPLNLYLRNERAAAFKAAETIEAKFGNDAKRLLVIAGFYLGIERAKETIRLAESAVKLAPDLAEAHRILAVGLHLSLRLDEAAVEYKKTLELDPASKVSRGSLADLYRASGKAEEALALYNEQLAADPKDKAAQAGKVISLFELSRTDEANSALEAALAAEPRNLPLLSGAAYWLAAHGQHEKAFDMARKAVTVEPRYTWAQIALARSYLGVQRPLDAERALRFARQYGKFPTLTYELANVLSSMGLYDESAEVLRESFTIKDGEIQSYLAGHVAAGNASFLELLAPERRAGIYQPTSVDSAANAKLMKALLAFNNSVTPATDGAKINEEAAVASAKEFAAGDDSMRAFRQMYAASRLLRNGVGMTTALELIAEARKAADDALKTPALTMAVQADEFRELRARSISAGQVPDVAAAPAELLAKIFNGRLDDLEGWALFNQEKYSEAITHIKRASETLPEGTPAWRTALWHLGAALEQTGQKEQALEAYLKSYRGGPRQVVRRSVIEQLYKSINGSLDGLEKRIGPGAATASSATPVSEPTTAPTPQETTAKPETTAAEPAKTETTTPAPEPTPTPVPETSQPMSDEELRRVASRTRSNIKITGRVVDANGTGIPDVAVVLISPSNTIQGATTDNKGNFSFSVPASQKTYRIFPSKDGYTFGPIDRLLPVAFEDLKGVEFIATRN